MTPLDTRAPDQRAGLELGLRRGRSCGELSELLEVPERAVRARADTGVRALAGETAAAAKRPGPVVLEGTLPSGSG